MTEKVSYTEANIKSLDWKEHIRLRPGMYIGKLGDGSCSDDGIYILLKEVIDNTIDEFTMGFGKQIDIVNENGVITVRDYGRGIPLGKVLDCAAKVNTGGKYDDAAFKKSVGLNGVGIKAVNALSSQCTVQSFRDGETKAIEFSQGNVVTDHAQVKTREKNVTKVTFSPDTTIFPNFSFLPEYVEEMLWTYAYLNPGLTLNYNGKAFRSENGLRDLVAHKTTTELLYPAIHLTANDIEVVITHGNNGDEYYSFVNGQHTTQGGKHLTAFREAIALTINSHLKKNYDRKDILTGIIAAISIRIQEPVFESQTKTKLGSLRMAPNEDAASVRTFILNFIDKHLDDFLHKNPQVAESLQKKILQSEREREELKGIIKLARDRAKTASLHNSKLRDCRIHYTDSEIGQEF